MGKDDLSNEQLEDEVAEHFYYFAYGSNLLTERLHLKNPSAGYVCNGVLTGYRLSFGGHGDTWGGSAATILEDKGQVVCGVVWKLGREHSKTLDLQEQHYRRLHVDVKILPANEENVPFTNGYTASFNTIRCRTYQMILDEEVQLAPCLPSPHYKWVILSGSKEHKLPLEYHKRLEAMPDNGFSGPVGICLSIFQDGHIPILY